MNWTDPFFGVNNSRVEWLCRDPTAVHPSTWKGHNRTRVATIYLVGEDGQ